MYGSDARLAHQQPTQRTERLFTSNFKSAAPQGPSLPNRTDFQLPMRNAPGTFYGAVSRKSIPAPKGLKVTVRWLEESVTGRVEGLQTSIGSGSGALSSE
jgi:hypothetical protein